MPNTEDEFRMPFEERWEELPTSVQNQVRIAIIMVGVWMFVMGVFVGAFVL